MRRGEPRATIEMTLVRLAMAIVGLSIAFRYVFEQCGLMAVVFEP